MKKLIALPAILALLASPAMAQEAHHETVIDDTGAPLSFNFGTWKPTREGECSTELHDTFSGINPEDNTRYHMFHPVRDPVTGCSFGHDHGHDPSASPLEEKFGPLYFAVANQHGMISGIQMVHNCTDQITGAIVRCEDNVGQKTLNGSREFTNQKNALDKKQCDVRVQFHMGTHSIDAATNNMHGATYQISCEDGAYADFTVLAQIAKPGGFTRKCDNARIEMGSPTPFNSTPVVNPLQTGNSFGDRVIVESKCIEGIAAQTVSGMYHELWRAVIVINSPVPTIKVPLIGSPKITNPNSAAGQWNWYWNTSYATRYLDAATRTMKYAIDTCKVKTETGAYLVTKGPCVAHRAAELKLGREIKWNDPESFARGNVYSMRLTQHEFKNGPVENKKASVWYTDTNGLNPSLTPFEGSLKWEGQPTEWYVNAVGTDARMVEYPGSTRVRMSAMTTNAFLSTDEPLTHNPPGAGTANNPAGDHAPQ